MGLHTHGITLSGGTSGTIGKITSLSTSGISRDSIDTSSCDSSDKWRTFVSGMIDAGEISGTIRFDKAEINRVVGAMTAVTETWTITLPDTSTLACSGFMTSGFAMTGEFENDITSDFTLKLTGNPTFTPAA